MGWRVLKQPDDRFAIWSTIAGDFVAYDMTEDEVKQACIEEAERGARDNVTGNWWHTMQTAERRGLASTLDHYEPNGPVEPEFREWLDRWRKA